VVEDDAVHLTGFGYAPLLLSGNSAAFKECLPFIGPEVKAKGSLTPATDIYAFAGAVIDAHPDLAPTQWYQKATAPNPEKRFQQMRDMCHGLIETLNGLAISGSNGHLRYKIDYSDNDNFSYWNGKGLFTEESSVEYRETDSIVDVSDATLHQADGSRQSLKQRAIKLSSIVALLLGMGIIPFIIPHFKPVCKVLTNCVEDDKYQHTYDEGMRLIHEARSLAAMPKNIAELNKARNTLNTAIKKLTAIPSDAKVYSELQDTLPGYWDELAQMEKRLAKYTKAQQQLNKANNIITNARAKTKAAKTIPQMEEAQSVWLEGQKMLNQAAPNLLVPDPAKQMSYESRQQVGKLEQRIDNVLAELERQRQAELEKQRQAELERQRQAELARQQEAERIRQAQAAQAARERQAQAAQAARERQRRQYSQTSNRNSNSSGSSSGSGQYYRRRRYNNDESSGSSSGSGQYYRRRSYNNDESSGSSSGSGQYYRRRRSYNNNESSGSSSGSGQYYRRRSYNNYDSSGSSSGSGQYYRRRSYNNYDSSGSGQYYRRRSYNNYDYSNSSGNYRRSYRRRSNDSE